MFTTISIIIKCITLFLKHCCHHYLQLSIANAKLQELNNKVKDLQREIYFLNVEKKRKLGVAHTLKSEIEENKWKAVIKKKLTAKIKKEVGDVPSGSGNDEIRR